MSFIPASEIVDFSQRTYGNKWQKRFEEDLVEILTRMGRPPQDTVTLVLQSLTTAEVRILRDVPMTSANRRAIRDAAQDREREEQQQGMRPAVPIDKTKLFRTRIDDFLGDARTKAGFSGAVIVARGGLQGAPRERSGLLPEDPVAPIADELAILDGDLCIVGHLPFMGYLAAELTSKGPGRPDFIFTTCAMLCLERYGHGDWAVRWFVSPDLLPL